jgi:hypothetical protein
MGIYLAIRIYLAIFGIILLSAAASWYFSAAQRLKRQLRAAQRWPLNELPEDIHGCVVGRARVISEQLTAPLTGRRCLYYIATVEEQRSNGRSSSWKTLASETRGVAFLLEDGTGHAIVDPNGAQVALDFDGKSSSGTFHDADAVQEAFLARHGLKSQGWVFNKSLRFREAIIEVGETVSVLGSGTREPDPLAAPEAAYRGAPATRLRLTSSARFPLIISDDPSTTQG